MIPCSAVLSAHETIPYSDPRASIDRACARRTEADYRCIAVLAPCCATPGRGPQAGAALRGLFRPMAAPATRTKKGFRRSL